MGKGSGASLLASALRGGGEANGSALLLLLLLPPLLRASRVRLKSSRNSCSAASILPSFCSARACASTAVCSRPFALLPLALLLALRGLSPALLPLALALALLLLLRRALTA